MELMAVTRAQSKQSASSSETQSRQGNRFILTICDYATRYPEAIPLPVTDAPQIARELVKVFARVGVRAKILTDQGLNFMSALLQDIYHLMQIKRIRTSQYHSQTDGLGRLLALSALRLSRSPTGVNSFLPF